MTAGRELAETKLQPRSLPGGGMGTVAAWTRISPAGCGVPYQIVGHFKFALDVFKNMSVDNMTWQRDDGCQIFFVYH